MPVTILVVEDDASALGGYLEFLTSAGFEPTGASNGTEALGLALANPPAAVITDISLPGINGFVLAEALRNDARTRHIPLLGLTAHWGVEISSRAARVGMLAVLLKPCVPSHLVAELKRVLAAQEPHP